MSNKLELLMFSVVPFSAQLAECEAFLERWVLYGSAWDDPSEHWEAGRMHMEHPTLFLQLQKMGIVESLDIYGLLGLNILL